MISTIREIAWKKQRVWFKQDHVQSPRLQPELGAAWGHDVLSSARELQGTPPAKRFLLTRSWTWAVLLWNRQNNTRMGGWKHESWHIPQPLEGLSWSTATDFEHRLSKKDERVYGRSNEIYKTVKKAWSRGMASAFRTSETFEHSICQSRSPSEQFMCTLQN